MFIGDSYVEGSGASDAETIPVQFSRLCQDECEVVNLGVAGISLTGYGDLLRDAAELLEPNCIFVVLCWNDLPSEYQRDRPRDYAIRFRNNAMPRLLQVARRWWNGKMIPLFYLRVPDEADYGIEGFAQAGGIADELGLPDGLNPAVRESINRGLFNPYMVRIREPLYDMLTKDYESDGRLEVFLRDSAERAAQAGAKLFISYIPSHFCVNPKYHELADARGLLRVDDEADWSGPKFRRQQQILAAITKQFGVGFVDTTDALISAEAHGIRTYWPLDGHCTAAGYEVVAKCCAEALQQHEARPTAP